MQEENKYPIGGYAPGNYQCHCGTCGGGFIGDKRAYQCEPCALNDKAKFDALSPSEQEELMKRNAEAIREAFKPKEKEQPRQRTVGVNDSAMYELRLAIYDMIRVTKALIENRGTLLNARKRVEAAEGILNKHFKITDVLRTESNEQPVEQKENEVVGKFLEWVYENGITRHSNGHWYKWDNGLAKDKYYADGNQHIHELYQKQNKQ